MHSTATNLPKRTFWNILALALLAALSLPAIAQSAKQITLTNASSISQPASGLSRLPASAQGPISRALGKNDSGYWVHRSADGFRGENPRNMLITEFSRRGAEVGSHNLRWGLQTRAYGYGTALHPVTAVAPQANANRVEYRRDGMTEWYENGPLGLEQGFTLAHRPGKANGQPLTLALELRGDLSPLEPAAWNKKSKNRDADLRGRDGKVALRYAGLEARGASGRELPSWLEIQGERLLLRVVDQGAQYPVVVDPWIQQAELTASDGVSGDEFGFSVAVSGSTIVVGAPYRAIGSNSKQGAAYVFVQSGGTWSEQAELTALDSGAGISYTIASPFAISPLSTCATTLESKKSCIFKVTFSPTAAGPATGTLTVTDSANDSPLSVVLEGDGD